MARPALTSLTTPRSSTGASKPTNVRSAAPAVWVTVYPPEVVAVNFAAAPAGTGVVWSPPGDTISAMPVVVRTEMLPQVKVAFEPGANRTVNPQTCSRARAVAAPAPVLTVTPSGAAASVTVTA